MGVRVLGVNDTILMLKLRIQLHLLYDDNKSSALVIVRMHVPRRVNNEYLLVL